MNLISTADVRARPAVYLGFLTAGIVALLLAAAIIVTYAAFDRQSSRLTKLEGHDRQQTAIERSIETTLSKHAKAIRTAVRLSSGSYRRGFSAGLRASALPVKLRRLENYVGASFQVPRALPPRLRSARVKIGEYRYGYSIRWAGVEVYASSRDPLRSWTKQSWPGSWSTRLVGGHKVLRMLGQPGIIYAWHLPHRTYGVISYPVTEPLARAVVASMR